MFAILFGYFTVILVVGCTVIICDHERLKNMSTTTDNIACNKTAPHGNEQISTTIECHTTHDSYSTALQSVDCL